MGQYNTRNKEEGLKSNDPIRDLPLELSLAVLSHLDATDLCLAGCVWNDLAHDEMLWMGLCKNWGYHQSPKKIQSYRKLYLTLDEGCLTFCADAEKGMEYFFNNGLIKDDPKDIANFFHCTNKLSSQQMSHYLDKRGDVLDHLIGLQNFKGESLPNALRTVLSRTLAGDNHGNYLHVLLDKFSRRFFECNPNLNLTPDTIYIVSFSLIILSVDLSSPHIKNKMSKREFIRNVRRAVGHRIDDDWCGHLYDDVYLSGHIASSRGRCKQYLPNRTPLNYVNAG
ncbi:F-box only protein 8-like [Daphnia pulicaria]|uniref:F-box only protein 8-like n=1 Tax=Daphnia pulicaria TaxID=35523 RepID=UPI001EEA8876|nr:F-box only protein 8-like [Daphnia pulicaria]